MQMEMASTHVDTIAALAQAAKANKAQLSENKIESVEEVLADIQEANQDMADIADALAAPTGFGMDVDEDDLEAELAVRRLTVSAPHSIYPSVFFGHLTPKI